MSKYHIPRLETNRLILRAVSLADAADMHEYASDQKVTDFTAFPKHESLAETQSIIRTLFLSKPSQSKPESFAIVLKENNKMIGTCDFWPVQGDACFEMGYVLNASYWNQGIMSEASQAVLDFAFGDYGVRRMELCHLEHNLASQKVALKLGFVYEGRKRKALKFKNDYKDLLIYGLLKEEL